ncbi:hypothetical protein SARC_09871 [Sphaeroforma arctica JP610]|uniref:Uncharacterized protein n=1 Tax=Sphaeroforma arctica JP610 TaxID=667725 RepID=A0A0L0FMF4_9EUKA|nr:hypothetical protein SARC_09871 [Sphaeroforma arctica JP610]KNC77671.1 hypothetical protein SARC_09871 [Sphaeroforma arctica JP610]|eukprot:XP_014151573.1 hypothetical protein SARC_09871 [Sphaeroforma arctica JP610]
MGNKPAVTVALGAAEVIDSSMFVVGRITIHLAEDGGGVVNVASHTADLLLSREELDQLLVGQNWGEKTMLDMLRNLFPNNFPAFEDNTDYDDPEINDRDIKKRLDSNIQANKISRNVFLSILVGGFLVIGLMFKQAAVLKYFENSEQKRVYEFITKYVPASKNAHSWDSYMMNGSTLFNMIAALISTVSGNSIDTASSLLATAVLTYGNDISFKRALVQYQTIVHDV